MKKRCVVFVLCTLLFLPVMGVSAAEAYDAGFIPKENSYFFGVQEVSETGWYTEAGTLTLENSGGYRGNNYLQFESDETAVSPKFDVAPFITGPGTYRLNVYIRLDVPSVENAAVQAKLGDQLLEAYSGPVRQNRWFLYSSKVTLAEDANGALEFEFTSLPAGRLCIDAFAILPYRESVILGGDKEENVNNGTISADEKNNFEWYSNLRNKAVGTVRGYYNDGLMVAGICLAIAVVVSLIILLVPFKKIWKKIKHKASAE